VLREIDFLLKYLLLIDWTSSP